MAKLKNHKTNKNIRTPQGPSDLSAFTLHYEMNTSLQGAKDATRYRSRHTGI